MDYTLRGTIRQSEDGSWEVDLRGEIAGVELPVKKRSATSTVSSMSEGDIDKEIDVCRVAIGDALARLAEDMAEVMAEGNKTGKVSKSKVLREIYRPLVSAKERLGAEALRYGMEQALAKAIPNVNYAKKVASGYGEVSVSRPATSTGARYDVLGG